MIRVPRDADAAAGRGARFWPLHAASACAMLGVDLLLHLLDGRFGIGPLNLGVVVLAGVCGVVVALVESLDRGPDVRAVSVKGALAALLVAAPSALLGVGVASASLVWSGLLAMRRKA